MLNDILLVSTLFCNVTELIPYDMKAGHHRIHGTIDCDVLIYQVYKMKYVIFHTHAMQSRTYPYQQHMQCYVNDN